jgi:hypothetical protein
MILRARAAPDPNDRLLAEWQPGAWIGSIRRAFGPLPELRSVAEGEVIDNHPSHWLVALWKPQRLQQPFLFRWPQLVQLVAGEDESAALLELLQHVPWGERMWMVHADIDWSLLAEIVMLTEPGLRAFHYQALRGFMAEERRAALARIGRSYGVSPDAMHGFLPTMPGQL